jgi:putative membrane protein
MVKDHRKDAEGYQKAQGQVKDPQLKTYVDNTLPVVESHLSMAEEIQKATAKK